jgi:type II secretory pathway pseudopilin PulG
MLVWVILLAALMLIALAAAAPVVAKDLQRDKEVESAHRANEYVRAIRLYYRKFKTYPASMDALQNTNNVRFLRKQYVDPLTGKSDWRIIHVGENKTTVKGFFGQPLGGLTTSGAGGLGSANSMLSNPGSPAGGATSPSNCTVSGGSALSAGLTGAATACPGTPGSSSSAGDLGSGGAGPIMGVGTAKTGDSILNPNGQTTYETWEFIYDPKIELLYQQANMLGGPASVNSQSPSNMNSNQNSPFGGSGNPVSTPTAPPTTTPQQ